MSAVVGDGISKKGRALSSGSLWSRQLWEQPLKAWLLVASISLLTWSPHSEAETTYSIKQILVLPRDCQTCLLSTLASILPSSNSKYYHSAWLLAVSCTAWTWNSGVIWAGCHKTWHAPSTNASLPFSPPLTGMCMLDSCMHQRESSRNRSLCRLHTQGDHSIGCNQSLWVEVDKKHCLFNVLFIVPRNREGVYLLSC